MGSPTRAGVSIYFRGLAGLVARLFHGYRKLRPRLASSVSERFETRSLHDRRHVYDTRVCPFICTSGVNWTLSRQFTLSLPGVPYPQRGQVQAQHVQGVAGFVRAAIEYVFRQLPVGTNCFWSLYLRGRYSETCCPRYLQREHFAALKDGLADRIRVHTCTVTDFLQSPDARISKFVLLDHRDWMSCYHPEALTREWVEILAHAAPGARVIFRGAHAAPSYLDFIDPGLEGGRLRDRLVFDESLARALQRHDRVRDLADRFPNVRVVEADAVRYRPAHLADCVYFSYSLTIIPDWRAAIDNALAMLKPGGTPRVVDFYVSGAKPAAGERRHGAFARFFWPRWFAHDGVHVTPDQLRCLRRRLPDHRCLERTAPLPYLPGLRVPYNVIVGRKPVRPAAAK